MSNALFSAEFKCPRCRSSHIRCWAEIQAILWPAGDGYTRADPDIDAGVEEILDTRRCECLECGKCGYLYQWEVK